MLRPHAAVARVQAGAVDADEAVADRPAAAVLEPEEVLSGLVALPPAHVQNDDSHAGDGIHELLPVLGFDVGD